MFDRVGQAWRFGATGFAIAAFSLGGGLLAAIVIPVLALLTPPERNLERRIQQAIRLTFSAYLRCIVAMRIIDLEIEGRARLAGCSGCVIVANHPTLLDVVLLLSLVPRGCCVVKHQLWRNFFFRGVVSRAGYVRNDLPAEELLGLCEENFATAGNLLVFPEGTRTETGHEPVFFRGFANIAILAGADLQLVAIHCDPPVLTRNRPWYLVPRKRPRFRVSVMERLPASSFTESPHRSLNARKLVRTLNTLYRTEFADA